jgi:hypothetical protein
MCLFNHKYDKVQEDGYQYCKNCGKAILAPCNHKWVLIHEIKMDGWDPSGKMWIYKKVYECETCRAVRTETIE